MNNARMTFRIEHGKKKDAGNGVQDQMKVIPLHGGEYDDSRAKGTKGSVPPTERSAPFSAGLLPVERRNGNQEPLFIDAQP
jgi:hypothetical protein